MTSGQLGADFTGPDVALLQLGKELFFDKISSPDSMSCATCHAPIAAANAPFTTNMNELTGVGAEVVARRVADRLGHRELDVAGGPAGDHSGNRSEVITGGVHKNKTLLSDDFRITVDFHQVCRTALGHGPEGLLQDGGQAAGFVARRRVVVDLGAVFC